MCTIAPSFSLGVWGYELSPYAWEVSALLTQPSPNLLHIFFILPFSMPCNCSLKEIIANGPSEML